LRIIWSLKGLDLQAKSFDAVMLIGVIEHLEKGEALSLIEKAERYARKKVILICPNGFLPQHDFDQNEYQIHRCGFGVKELRRMGYKVYGMSGAKYLMQETDANSHADKDVIYANVRFRPKLLFYLINALLQSIVYYIPKQAFGLIAVKMLR